MLSELVKSDDVDSASSGDQDHGVNDNLSSKQGFIDISQVQDNVPDEVIEDWSVVDSDGEYSFEEEEYDVEVEEECGSSSEDVEYEYEYEYEYEEEADDSSVEYIEEEVVTTDDEEEDEVAAVVSGEEEEITEVTLTDHDLTEDVILPEDKEFDKDLLEEYYQLYGNVQDGTVLFDITKLKELDDERKNPGEAKTDFVPNLPPLTLLTASELMAIKSRATARAKLRANETKVIKKTKTESITKSNKSKKIKHPPKSSEGDKVESVDREKTPVKKKKIKSSSKKVKASCSASGREKISRLPQEKKLKKEMKPEKKKSPSSIKSNKSKLAIANLKMLMSPRRTQTPMEIERKLLSPRIASHIPKVLPVDNSPGPSPIRRAQSLQISPRVAPSPLHALDGLLPANKDKLMSSVQELERSFSSPHVAQFLKSPNAKLGTSRVKKSRLKNVMSPNAKLGTSSVKKSRLKNVLPSPLDDGNQQSPVPPPTSPPSPPPPQETYMQMVNERISTGPTSDLLKQMRQSFDPMKSPLVAQFLRSPSAKLGLALAKTNRPSFKVPSLDDSDSDSDSVDEKQVRSSDPVTAAHDSEKPPLISSTAAEESPIVRNRIVPIKNDTCEQFGISQNGSCVRHPNINVYNFEDGSIDICQICRSENHGSGVRQRRSMAFAILEVQNLHLSPRWKKWHDKVDWVSESTNTNNEQACEETGAPINEEKRLHYSNTF
jgi:hypothetical protein